MVGKWVIASSLRPWVSRKLILIAFWVRKGRRFEGGGWEANWKGLLLHSKVYEIPWGLLVPSIRLSETHSGNASGKGQADSSPLRNFSGFKFSLSLKKSTIISRLDTERDVFLSCSSRSGGNQAMLRTALRRGPYGEERKLQPAASVQWGLPTAMWLS